MAIVGRPNVGKSTLFNRLVGEERSVVHDMAGTTRDSIDTVVDTEEGRVRFVDTAGLRRKAKTAEGAEYYSLVRALQAIDRADTALLVIDATEEVTHQDQRLAERIDAAGSPVVIVLNKWELLDAEARQVVVHEVAEQLSFLSYAPVLKISAESGLGVHKLLPALGEAIEAYNRRIPTAVLNRVIQAAQAAHPAPQGVRIQYATQGAVHPPTFTLFATKEIPAHVPPLHRAEDPGALRARSQPHQAPRAAAGMTGVLGALLSATGDPDILWIGVRAVALAGAAGSGAGMYIWGRSARRLQRALNRQERALARTGESSDGADLARSAWRKELHTALLYAVCAVAFLAAAVRGCTVDDRAAGRHGRPHRHDRRLRPPVPGRGPHHRGALPHRPPGRGGPRPGRPRPPPLGRPARARRPPRARRVRDRHPSTSRAPG